MTRKNRRTRNKSIRRKTKRTPIKGRKSMKKKSQRKERRSIRKGRRTNRKQRRSTRKQRRSTRKQMRSTFRKRRSSRKTRKKRSIRKHRQDGGASEGQPIVAQVPVSPLVENDPASNNPPIGTDTLEADWKEADKMRKKAGLPGKDNPTSSSQATDSDDNLSSIAPSSSVASSDASSSWQTPEINKDLGLDTSTPDPFLETSASAAMDEAVEQVQGQSSQTQSSESGTIESIGPVSELPTGIPQNVPEIQLYGQPESSSSSDLVIEFLNGSDEKLQLEEVGEGDKKDVQVSPKDIMEKMKDLIIDENMVKELFEAKDEASFKSAMNNIGKNLSPDQQILTFPNGNKINIPKLIEKINDSPGGPMIEDVQGEPSSTATTSTEGTFVTGDDSPGGPMVDNVLNEPVPREHPSTTSTSTSTEGTYETADGDDGTEQDKANADATNLDTTGPLDPANIHGRELEGDTEQDKANADATNLDTTGPLDPANIHGRELEGDTEQDQANADTISLDTTGPLDPANIHGRELEGDTERDQVSFEEKKPGEVKNIVSGLIKIPENVEVPKEGTQEREEFENNYAKSVAEKLGVSKGDVMVQIIDDMIGGGYYHLGGASVQFTIRSDPQKISEVKENLKDNNLLIDGQNVSLDVTGQTVNLFPSSDISSSLDLDSTPQPIATDSSDKIPVSDNGSEIFDKIIDDLETLYAGCGLKGKE